MICYHSILFLFFTRFRDKYLCLYIYNISDQFYSIRFRRCYTRLPNVFRNILQISNFRQHMVPWPQTNNKQNKVQ